MQSLIDSLLLPCCCACGQCAPLAVVDCAAVRVCRECAIELIPALQQVPLLDFSERYACYDYAGPLVSLLSMAKDQPNSSQHYAVQDMFVAAATNIVKQKGVSEIIITQVPSSLRRSINGWYLPLAMARALSSKLGAKHLNLLRRRKQVVKQASLGAVERRINLHQCFTPSRCQFTNTDPNATVIIVDDVSTTGASLREAVRCVKLMGYTQIMAISLAIAPLRSREC